MRAKKNLRTISKIVKDYADKSGTEIETALQDMITDIKHFCDSKNISFSEVAEYADRVHYQAESEEWVQSLPLTKLPTLINQQFGDSTDEIHTLIKRRFKEGK